MSYHTVGLIVFASCSTILAIQRYVFPCGRVALWFQVGKQLRGGLPRGRRVRIARAGHARAEPDRRPTEPVSQ
jgi:hypothetical protein